MKTYTSKGIVWGDLWLGGKCGYKARTVTAATKQKLLAKVKKMLDDGSLDAGMGFASLYGAYLTIKVTDTKTINGKEYVHADYDDIVIGNLTNEEIEASIYNA